MRAWLLANRYVVSAVALTILCILALGLVAQPWACANRSTSTTPAAPTLRPTLKPVGAPTEGTPPPSLEDPAGETEPALPGIAPQPAGEAQPDPPAPFPPTAGGELLACSSGGDLDWSTTAADFQVVCQCTLTMPRAGWAYLSAGGSLSGRTCEYEAHFRLGIDDSAGDPATDRWVNIYGDASNGMDAVLALSALRELQAGTHTFYLLGRHADGTGSVLLMDPSLAVIAWPAPAP